MADGQRLLRTGYRALRSAEPKAEPLPPFDSTPRPLPLLEACRSHLAGGGSVLVFSWTSGPLQPHRARVKVNVDRRPLFFASEPGVLLVSAGRHSLQVPSSRGLPGRTGGAVELPAGAIVRVEYAFVTIRPGFRVRRTQVVGIAELERIVDPTGSPAGNWKG